MMPSLSRLAALAAFLCVLGSSGPCSPDASKPLPVSEDFSGKCIEWVEGENSTVSYGCSDDAYEFEFKKEGSQDAFLDIRPTVDGLMLEAGVSVVRGEAREQQGAVGLGCLATDDAGYFALVDTPPIGWAIQRWEKDGPLTVVAEADFPDPLPTIPDNANLTLECQSHDDGSTSVEFQFDGEVRVSGIDRNGLGPFTGIALSVASSPGIIRYDNLEAREVG
jgi:hypothetical protein